MEYKIGKTTERIWDIGIKILIVALLIVLAAVAFYHCCPKYEIYVSGGDGSITYRFNTVTGIFQSIKRGNNGDEWTNTNDFSWGGIKKP